MTKTYAKKPCKNIKKNQKRNFEFLKKIKIITGKNKKITKGCFLFTIKCKDLFSILIVFSHLLQINLYFFKRV